ncbi:hypothetical protein DFH09DRAFT_1370097 [Mycena vulgaris]|nr:hypothetical protein DFH09DRAFT_1370097 [Mycena vulgaris]
MNSAVCGEESRLPPELERQIFEIAALSRPVAIPTLMLVAWRVKTWLEPLLYRVVSLTDRPSKDGFPHFTSEILLRAVHQKPAGFLEKSVRHLYLWQAYRCDMAVILPACTGVTSLFVMTTGLDLHSVGDMQDLRRLAIEIGVLFSNHDLDFTHHLFRNITHLEIFDERDPPISIWAGLPLVPNLTHLSFWGRMLLDIAAHSVLPACPRLQYLVFLGTSTSLAAAELTAYKTLAADPRFVAVALTDFEGDWLHGAQLGQDYWSSVEVFVAAKRTGQIASSEYAISVDGSSQ